MLMPVPRALDQPGGNQNREENNGAVRPTREASNRAIETSEKTAEQPLPVASLPRSLHTCTLRSNRNKIFEFPARNLSGNKLR